MPMIVLLSLVVVILSGQGLLAVLPAHAEELDCLIEPKMVVHVTTEAEGVVKKVLVDRGDLVREGQVVALLESSLQEARVKVATARAEAEANLKTQKARVAFAGRKLKRTRELAADGISSLSELDEAETEQLLAELSLVEALENQRIAKLELQYAETQLRMRRLRSPVRGVVVERILSPGDLAGRDPVLKIAQIDPLRVEVFAPISLLGKIPVGMRAQVRPEVPVGSVHTARVTIVDRVVDAASGTFGIRLELPNPRYRLPSGLKCKVHLPPK
ncbi:MAG: efflux RND transporter periplasmic adaptor subunit [Gemmatimonadetes bacterium]|nr:efflux RND transporter periplasmic adaptor subunit [Gemmatimonadota bacterium]